MRLTRKHVDILAGALIALMLSSSMTLLFMDSLSLRADVWKTALICGAGAAWCALMAWNRPARAAGLLLGAAGAFWLFRYGGAAERLRLLIRTLAGLLAGGEGSAEEAQEVIRAVLGAVLSLAAFALSRLQGGVFPAATVFCVVAMAGWSFSHRLTPIYAAPGAAALIMMYANAREGRPGYWRAAPLAAVVTAAALLLLPAGRPTWKPLEDAAEKVRQMFEDYFLFTDPRTAYSLAADGYQPMGERLGGPATPREGTVMVVETEEKLWLRGSVRRAYTGRSWSDGGVNSRYLFRDPTRSGVRAQVFNIRQNEALPGSLVRGNVTFTADGISTLFVPGRLVELELPIDVAAYYNDRGDVFITRGVEAGDRYGFTAFLPRYGEDLRRALSAAAQGRDEGYEDARADYMELPKGISRRVYEMVEDIVADCETPYDKAVALRNYLMRHYTYAVDVEYPPADRDFVSYFLLDGKKGYCSYFATAMAVMARMADMPARYVEGYLVKPDESGVTEVTGVDAHAWVEIYFDGAGWIPFDPTPGNEWTLPDDGQQPQATPAPAPEGSDDAGDNGEPEPTPTPEAGQPTPDISGPDEAERGQPTPPPEGGEPEPTPTPPPEEEPQAEPTPPPEPPREQNRRDFPWWILLLILAALALMGAAYARVAATRPQKQAEKIRDADTRLMLWYRHLSAMLEACGFAPDGGESPAAFAERLKGAGPWSQAYAAFADAVCRRRYGGKKSVPEDFLLAESAYRAIWRAMTRRQKSAYLAQRALGRLGDLKNVP